VREAVQQLIDDVLSPLLESDASSIELLAVSEDEVVVRVTGRAAYGVGAEFVRTGVIEPALRKVVGEECAIHIKKTIPTAKRRA
jgi:Fe-S cluster biogenesis protein NfuA